MGLGGPMGDELAELACRARSEGGLGRLNTLLAAGSSTLQETAADELLERARARPAGLAKVVSLIEAGSASAVEDPEDPFNIGLPYSACRAALPPCASPRQDEVLSSFCPPSCLQV